MDSTEYMKASEHLIGDTMAKDTALVYATLALAKATADMAIETRKQNEILLTINRTLFEGFQFIGDR